MSKKDKLLAKLLNYSITFDELTTLLLEMSYELSNKGKTSGSRVKFVCENRSPILIHRPHPQNIMKEYAIKQIIETLQTENLI